MRVTDQPFLEMNKCLIKCCGSSAIARSKLTAMWHSYYIYNYYYLNLISFDVLFLGNLNQNATGDREVMRTQSLGSSYPGPAQLFFLPGCWRDFQGVSYSFRRVSRSMPLVLMYQRALHIFLITLLLATLTQDIRYFQGTSK